MKAGSESNHSAEDPRKTFKTVKPALLFWESGAAWQEVNQCLHHLVVLHKPKLVDAVCLAHRIHDQLEFLSALLDDLCAVTCPHCPEPCCLTAKVWLDFYDLLFLHLCGHFIPPAQMLANLKDYCRYWGPRGCILPRIVRPWICTWYLCPTQRANLRRKSPAVQERFDRMVQNVKRARKKMESEFIKVVAG